MSRIYALANQKGGVGKTTTAINVAACLAESGVRVLLVDFDPQANATTGLGLRANGVSTHDLLDGAPLRELAKPTAFPNLDVVPSKPELAAAAVHLSALEGGERYLADALSPDAVSAYGFVFLDCPPAFGPLTVNALAAATRVIVPVQCEYYALEGLAQLERNIDLVQRNLNPALELSSIVLVMYDGRTRLSDEVVSEVRDHYGSRVARTVIPRNVRLSEAPSHGKPITTFDPSSRGAVMYKELAREVHRVST